MVLGLRATSKEIRYALLEKDASGKILFLNQSAETKLKYPAGIKSPEAKLLWVKTEIDNILRRFSNVEKIVVKMNEYSGTENGSKRETSYMDAIFLLCAEEHSIPVQRKLYSQIGAKSATVKELAESWVGKTEQYWDTAIADAIAAAFWEVRK